MGNHVSSRQLNVGKVILSDGTVHEYDKTLTVAELMLEHQQQVVVEFRADGIGRRPSPLPADMKLDKEKVYVMLPVRRGKPAGLSSDEARRILFQANAVLKSRSFLKASGFLPLFSCVCQASGDGNQGCEQQFVVKKREELAVENKKSEVFAEVLEESRPEFLSRQLSGKSWKPSLDTITEKSGKPRVGHWLLIKQTLISQAHLRKLRV